MNLKNLAALATTLIASTAFAGNAPDKKCGAGSCSKKTAPAKTASDASCGKKEAACSKKNSPSDASCSKKEAACSKKAPAAPQQ